MDNFETLRKDWTGLKSGSGEGGSGFPAFKFRDMINLTAGVRTTSGRPELYLYPAGGTAVPMTMQQLLDLGAMDKPVTVTLDGGTLLMPLGVREDGSWWLLASYNGQPLRVEGSSLADELLYAMG